MRLLAIALTAVLIVLSVVAIVGGFALLARRLLGMRFGMVRLLVAGLLGFAVAGPIARAVLGAVPTTEGAATPVWFLVLASASALVVAMVFLVVAEALVPTGSLPGPLEWRRALRGRLARARRYSQISRIAFRHGLGPYLRGRRRAELDTPAARDELARSVRQALDEGGVTFVKLGQILSTRPDLLPPEFTDELGHLQDQAAPAPWPQVEQVLRADLGGPVEEVFARFDREPLAAASIAQVHAARLRSSAEVVVKVQRPGIRLVVERDLDIVARLARTVETAPAGGVPSASATWRPASPTPSARSSTSASRPPTWPRSRRRVTAGTARWRSPSRTRRCAPSGSWSCSGWRGHRSARPSR
jgi:ubiquinone biosynthesis protein